MAVELSPQQLERLLAIEQKFAKEGLAFDDVLLVPAESRVLPNDVATTTRLTSSVILAIPLLSAPIVTTLEQAEDILQRTKIEKMPVVDADDKLTGLITVKDIQKKIQYPNA